MRNFIAKTLNSTYELKGSHLFRNGELYTTTVFAVSEPGINGPLVIYYTAEDGHEHHIWTSPVQTIEFEPFDEQEETNGN